MKVEPLDGKAALLDVDGDLRFHDVETIETECLILGGGPAGLAAAIELGKAGVNVILVDDKAALGGKLVLQTHKFFGSIEACHAGTRGMDIGKKLEAEVRAYPERAPLDRDHGPGGVLGPQGGRAAREPLLPRPAPGPAGGHRRPREVAGLQGQHAARRLRRRRLPDPGEPRPRAAHGAALRHRRRQRRPHRRPTTPCRRASRWWASARRWTSAAATRSTRTSWCAWACPSTPATRSSRANGKEEVESVTIAQLDPAWKIVPGTEKTFKCDTVLVAVGLDPVDEFLQEGQGVRPARPRGAATPRRSPRPARPCSPARSGAPRSPGCWAATWARCPPSGSAPPRS